MVFGYREFSFRKQTVKPLASYIGSYPVGIYPWRIA